MPCQIEIQNKQLIKPVKTILEHNGALSKSSKIKTIDGISHMYCSASSQEVEALLSSFENDIIVRQYEETYHDLSFLGLVREFLLEQNAKSSTLDVHSLMSKVPKKWTIYPPMVLFGAGGFDSEIWTAAFSESVDSEQFFKSVRAAFPATITHFAVNKPIVETDILRRPFNLVPLYGDFGPEPSEDLFDLPESGDLHDAFWCHAVQNGIYQTWAPRYTMFSRGNIKEKKRVLDTFKNLEGLVVMDFYAGIGYFTLSYLANNATLLCWELNPWSIEGLVRGLAKNGYKYKLIREGENFSRAQYDELVAAGVRAFVFHESNENVSLRLAQWGQLPISHVNLGLLPSLQASWPIVKEVRDRFSLRNFLVHIHENEHKDNFLTLQQKIAGFFSSEVTHFEKVKTFAPDVWHIVADIDMDQNGPAAT